ncbi:AT-rich interactive domain-containing protein 4A isoform X2 [Neocloeon triangulifer]|uniref:AT-rich interactive domain-containing protein 4A isoform X2 n=1 Tax=Neocloeon triangulifer TaxID=2078957 RepID=UPI00286F5104|nr:AT-rich interactive domain-containing protein 4A isoform X2 [Neocloeon triangulifer]
MHASGRRRDGDEPPYLTEGTEVSAKYKGAFCEAKVRKVVRSVKCRVTLKSGGTIVVQDDQITGHLMNGANVEVKLPDKKDPIEGTIAKIQDCSQYTVVFDDGDITTLRRTALCLKSGRHFAEGDTLDKLPLTHPEHFSNPVVNNRRGRRSRQAHDDSMDDDGPKKGKKKEEREADIGKVVCVEVGDKKKVKDNWFPGLVVEPTAQDTVKINVKDEYLVRSFKDGRYYTVPKKEAFEFTREIGAKVDNNSLKAAVDKAVLFLDKDELPPHWDRDLLFGLEESSDSDTDGSDSESERQEDKDQFVAKLFTFMEGCGSPINNAPSIYDEDLDLHKLFKVVERLGGYNKVTAQSQWKLVTQKLNLMNITANTTTANLVKNLYKKYLHGFEDFNRKLGCTMQNSPHSKSRRRTGGRSIIREKDRATPVSKPSVEKEKQPSPAAATPKSEKKAEKGKQQVKSEKKTEEGVKKDSKVRSERLQNKKDEGNFKKRLWKEDSQSDNEGGPPPPIQNQRVEPSTSSTPEPKVAKRKVESEESSDEEELQAEKREKRVKTRIAEEELKKKSETPDKKVGEVQTPIREEKKPLVKSKAKDGDDSSSSTAGSITPSTVVAKKRGRKRKESEKTEEHVYLASDIQIQVGDKLKVYYGPQDEAKVTYEAKVIDIDVAGGTYMVHYTGWNTRYDEWVKRDRIAINLSWTPARAKRTGRPPAQPSPSPQTKGPSKVVPSGPPNMRSSRSGKDSSTRSTTPSSVTSSSSRTKSPAQSSRAQRAVKRSERLRRPRRISGTDDKYSDSESDESDDDEEEEAPRPRLRRDSTSGSDGKVGRRKIVKKEVLDEEEGKDSDSQDSKRRSKRDQKSADSDSKEEEDDESVDEQKGRNFNLSQLRSEMRGFDKALKSTETAQDAQKLVEVKTESLAKEARSEDLFSMDDDDIYEFKEPEPFKPENRLKRESVPEDKFKAGSGSSKQTPPKAESPATKRKFAKKDANKTSSIDLPIVDEKRRRRTTSKQDEVTLDKDWSAGSGDSFKSLSASPPAFSADIPSTTLGSGGKKPIYASTSLFGDPHSGQEDEEQDDRLVISESAAGESPSLPFEIEPSVEGKKEEAAVEEKQGKELAELVVKTEESDEGTLAKVPVSDTYRKYLEEAGEWPKRKQDLIHETIERVIQQAGDEKKLVKPSTSTSTESLPPKVTLLKAVPITEVKNLSKDSPLVAASKIKVEDLKKTTLVAAGKGTQISFLVHTVTKKVEPVKPEEEKSVKAPAENLSTKPLQSWKSNSRELCKALRKEPRKKALKKTVSKEFIDDDDSSSESDSSEDLKLVIDRLEESGQESSDSESVGSKKKSKQDKKKQQADEEESSLNSLLCEETIPGSPVPGEEQVVVPKKVSQEAPKVREIPFASMVAGGSSAEGGNADGPSTSKGYAAPAAEEKPDLRKDENDAAPVMENTPPTTPDSSSSISGSPARDQSEKSPKQDSGKSEQDLSEVDLDSPIDGAKGESEDSMLNVDVGCESPTTGKGKTPQKKGAAAAKDNLDSLGKKTKRKSRKEAEVPTPKRSRYSAGRSARNMDAASDSDDNVDSTNLMSISIANTDNLLANQPSRPSRYNFYAELDPSMECSQRIQLLQTRLQELRKTYMTVKAELAFIDRRRKKLRRKEREASKTTASKQEVWCAT